MNLFQIDAEILKSCIDTETGEVINEELLDQLEMERDAKIKNIALWIKNLKAEAEALKEQKMIFAARQSAAENKMESLKKYLGTYLGGEAFKTPEVAVSFRKSESVEVRDIQSILALDNADDYLKYSEPTVNKTAIKEALKKGIEVPGAELVTNSNIQIK